MKSKTNNKKQLNKKKKKRPIYIVVNGQVVDNTDCDYCNYNECESCPTWHGWEVDND